MSKKQAKIEKIVVRVAGTKVEMTKEEAESLHRELAELFEKPAPYVPPIVIERDRRPWYVDKPYSIPCADPPPKITCESFSAVNRIVTTGASEIDFCRGG